MDRAPLKVREAQKGRKLIYITFAPVTGVDGSGNSRMPLTSWWNETYCPHVICSTSAWHYIGACFREVQWNVPGWYHFLFLCKPRSCLHSKCQWEVLMSWMERTIAINRILQFRSISDSKQNAAISWPLNEQQGALRSSWVDNTFKHFCVCFTLFLFLSTLREYFWGKLRNPFYSQPAGSHPSLLRSAD